LFISGLLHAFWILPTAISGGNPLSTFGSEFTSYGMVKFLSFAKFENTISLLHPNWPENIFGKVYFMRSEFLILPVLAFSSLFFLRNEKKSRRELVLFFSLVAIIGAFLAKGANDPFGEIYNFLFTYVPGFSMFRDPTKWYALIAISYSILIPFATWKICERLKLKNKSLFFNLQNPFFALILFCLLALISPAISGRLSGIFQTTKIPQDYIALEKFLSQDNSFYRILLVPRSSKYSFYSTTHPIVQASGFLDEFDTHKLTKKLNNKKVQENLNEISIRYVIVPYDRDGEIFLKDRKYDEEAYLQTIKDISLAPWLKKIDGFGRIAVFENLDYKEHFYVSNKQSAISNQKISYQYISPVEYKIDVRNVKKGDLLVFSESFDQNWSFTVNELKTKSQKHSLFNGFELPRDGNYSVRVYYEPQKYVNIGLVISGITLASVIFLLGFGYVTKKW
jgi:hypothetical protein